MTRRSIRLITGTFLILLVFRNWVRLNENQEFSGSDTLASFGSLSNDTLDITNTCDRPPQSCAIFNIKTNDDQSSRPNVFFISRTESGGSKKYIEDLVTHFGGYGIKFHSLKSKHAAALAASQFRQNDILLFQYLLNTDFTFSDVMKLVRKHGLRLIVPIHDRYFLSRNRKADYAASIIFHTDETDHMPAYKKNFLRLADHIIFPSPYIYNEFREHIDLPSMVVVSPIDQQLYPYVDVPPLQPSDVPASEQGAEVAINIGIITQASEVKGLDLFQTIFGAYKVFSNMAVRFFYYADYDNHALGFPSHVVQRGSYQENDIYSKLRGDQIHGLMFLNVHPETYSYALTKGINSGLPILYTDIGAIKERMATEKQRAPQGKYVATDNSDLAERFEELLAFILEHAGKGEANRPNLMLTKNSVVIPPFYDRLFFREGASSIMDCVVANHAYFEQDFVHIHRWIEPYAIYFPQFHPIPENDANFYAGYTDMVNLIAAKAEDPALLTPLKHVLGFYDLVHDREIIPKQVQMAKSYGLAGFGIYYYWFSVDSISGKHMIFQDAIDQFFETAYDKFSVFFIYCNENWTNNAAFDSRGGTYVIESRYDRDSILANMENLSRYAIHPNYRKIGNRPVFFLHHPDEMTEDEVRLLKEIGDQVMQEHGFDGIELVVDIRGGKVYPAYPYYYTHANYKSKRASAFMDDSTRPRTLDYQKYLEEFLPNEGANGDNVTAVNSAFVNFDNFVRFYMHNNSRVGGTSSFITRSKNRKIDSFKRFLDIQFDKYSQKGDHTSRLFLINAWNEWGEQMALEPSNEEGFLYLEALRERLVFNFAVGRRRSSCTF